MEAVENRPNTGAAAWADNLTWVKKTFLAVALLVAVGWLAGPSFKRYMIVNEHRQVKFGVDPGLIANGLGFAKRSQLHSQDWGPTLLGDPAVTRARVEELAASDQGGGDHQALIKYRGEWALMFAALRLQGQSKAQILASPHGLELTLATLAAEADPPHWWAQAQWLRDQTKASPVGSFRMGLLSSEDVPGLVSQADKLGEHQLPCLVHCVLRHEDGFSVEQRTAVLNAWNTQQGHYFSPNNRASVTRVLAARQSLIDLVGRPSGPLALEIAPAPGFTAEQQAECRNVVEDFARSCGYQPRTGTELRVELALQIVDFGAVASDTFVPYTTTERVKVGQVGGKYGFRSVYEDREVEKNERKSEVGEAYVVSLVWRLQRGVQGLNLEAPPYGEITQEKLSSMGEIVSKQELSDSERSDLDWYFRNNAASTWRYGLDAYERDWNVEDRMK